MEERLVHEDFNARRLFGDRSAGFSIMGYTVDALFVAGM